ncbi:MAG: ABC transporter substrate-binding protein, partial [Dehalococcoidia bacterium]
MRRRAVVTARWPLLALLLAGSAAIVGLWFAIAQPLAESESDDGGGRYVEGIAGQPQRINPLLANLNNPDLDVARLVFSGLTRLGPSGEILPDLAQSWDISKDGRTYTFHLNPNARWHNGDRLTAADVVFTYALMAGPDFPGDPKLGQAWQQVKACEAVDDLTVRCKLPAPYAPFLSLTTIGIVPKKPLQGILAAN